MSFFSSPKHRRDHKDRRGDSVESPTTPSDRPLMYLSSSSGSSSFEEAPFLSESESPTSHRSTTESCKRRTRTRCLRRYRSCSVLILSLVGISYFYYRKETSIGHDPNTQISRAKPIHTGNDSRDGPIEGALVLEQQLSASTPSAFPTAKPTPLPDPPTSMSRTPKSSLRPSPLARPMTESPTSPPTWKPTQSIPVTLSKTEVSKQPTTKRNLVLHIGPQKTGSTTLQDAWAEPYGLLSTPLTNDNYRYRFIHPSHGYFDCDLSDHGGYKNCQASSKLKGLIRTAKNDGKHLLLSDENLDERFPETLRDVIDDHWNVTIIVVYRRIHQWLISWYDQINKTTNKDAKGIILFDTNGNPYRKEHTEWPDEGGVPIPTFSTWYKEFTKYWDPSELVGRHRSIAFMNDYKPYFNNIVVHNMHKDGDFMTNFMCDSVPDAQHACGLLKSQTKRLPRDNQSVNLDYDILAVKAREEGVLMTSFKRKFVGSRIEKFVRESKKQLPRVCDVEMIDEIKKWLLDSEKTMFPSDWSDEKESYLQSLFDSYIETGKMCDIDFEKVFADADWLDFFKSLDNRPHLVLHIGPQKTGSTTLQHVWTFPNELGNLLREDNFDYHYINPHQGMFECGMIGDTWDDCKASQKLKNILANASAERKNLILSDENLDERFVNELREVISDKDFRVKVVVVYRRIYRWLPSWYSQINKTANKDSNGNLLRNENGQPQRRPHTKWPSKGGVHIPNFSEWYPIFFERIGLDSRDLAAKHPSIHFKNVYEPYFEHVEVYNMEQEGDLVTNFMCQMIPEAPETCRRLKESSVVLPHSNPSQNVEHDILSVQAYERGLIEPTLQRSRVVEEVQKRLQNHPDIHLPKHCNTDINRQIHEWFIESERRIFPDASESDVLEKVWTSDSAADKVCDIDTDAILLDEDWIKFFASLGRDDGR